MENEMGFEHIFSKVVRSSEKIEVPVGFVWKMEGSLCILRDGDENVWSVEVCAQEDNRWYFLKGWAKLYRDKSLKEGDILLFKYMGNNLFRFKLFGGKNDDYNVEEDEDDDEEDEQVGAETTNLPLSNKRYKMQNTKSVDYYCEEIFKSGQASRPDNPYFVSRSRTISRKNELYIPKDVVVDYDLKIPEKMYIVDGSGRKWASKMNRWKDGRVWCTRGWKRLRTANNIKPDDICICEFQGCNTDMMSLRVHVLDI